MSSKIFLLSEYIAVRGIIRTLLKNSFKVLVSGYLTNLIHGLVNLFQAVYNFRVCFFCFFFCYVKHLHGLQIKALEKDIRRCLTSMPVPSSLFPASLPERFWLVLTEHMQK